MPSNNKIWGVGGIILTGYSADICNNTFVNNQGYSIGFDVAYVNELADGDGYTINIKNNIIVGTREANTNGDQSGAGICKFKGPKYKVTCSGNCLHDNVKNYYGVMEITNDICADPLFVDPGHKDFHLQSEAGHWTSTGKVKDSKTSPSITSYGECGRYSGSPQASVSPYMIIPDLQTILEGNAIVISCNTEDRYKLILDKITAINLQEGKDFVINATVISCNTEDRRKLILDNITAINLQEGKDFISITKSNT
jgi:hypothetical protein